MALPRWLARFNRRFTNRIFRLFAGRLPPWVIMHHRGRSSGHNYDVPLAAFRVDGGFVFALTYGSGADWVQNVLAAGECQIVRGGVVHSLSNPRLIPAAEGFSLTNRPVQLVLRLIRCNEFLAMDEA
jgi:deazaflavin-dependent oxidoreductase (nitroreductase family)